MFLLLIVPNSSYACFASPKQAPGYSVYSIPGYISGKSKTDVERDEEVWLEMGYFHIAPSDWGEIGQISNKYYSLQVFQGGPGSCGPESMYIYKTLLNNSALGIVGLLLFIYVLNKYRTRVKS